MSVAGTAALPVERSLSFAGLVVLAIGSLDMSLEQSMILPALPALARKYEASLIATSWRLLDELSAGQRPRWTLVDAAWTPKPAAGAGRDNGSRG